MNVCDNDTDDDLDGVHVCMMWMHALPTTNSYIDSQVHNVCMSSGWVGPGVGVTGNLTVMGSGVLGTRRKGVRVYICIAVCACVSVHCMPYHT